MGRRRDSHRRLGSEGPPHDTITIAADAFAAQVDPKGLAGLTVKEVRFPLASMKNDAKYLKNMAAMAKVYGADESTERVALIALGQSTYTVRRPSAG